MVKMAFLTVIGFFSAFSKILIKRTFVCLLFLKLNLNRNMKKKIFFGVFHQKPKTCFFGGPKWKFIKLKFRIFFLHVFLNEKEASCRSSEKNINI